MENNTIKKKKVLNILSQEEVLELYNSEGIDSRTINDMISDFERELENIQREIDNKKLHYVFFKGNDYSQDIEINQLNKKYDELKDKIRFLKHKYNNYHLLYRSLLGKTLYNRKYPSDELRNKIVCGHLDFAKKIALEFYYKLDKEYEFDDLYQIACEGLISAAHYYVPSDLAKFTTYARKCMSNKILKETNKKKTKKVKPYKANEFFLREFDRIRYIEMFLDANKKRSDSGKYYYDVKKPPKTTTIIADMKNYIRRFNVDVKETGESYRSLPYPVKHNYGSIIKNITNYIKESKISSLISDEDMELISLELNYNNINGDSVDIYHFNGIKYLS